MTKVTIERKVVEQALPCPFCGKTVDLNNEDTLYPTGTGWKIFGEYRTYHSFREVPKEQWCWGMHCPTVAGGCGAEIHGDSKKEALQKWNTRSAFTSPAPAVPDAAMPDDWKHALRCEQVAALLSEGKPKL